MAILGQVTVDELSILSVDADPSSSGVVASIGSLAMLDDQANGKIWVKSGAGSTAWSIVPRLASGTAFTSGSVLFADASGFISQNNSMLFWDNTNFRLGMGLATPQSRLHMDGGTAVGSHIRFTAGTTTGQTSGDGFEIGIDSAGNGDVRQRENSPINVFTNNTQVACFTAAGQVLFGNTATAIDITGASAIPQFQIIGTAAIQMAGIQYSADLTGPVFNLLKSRGATIGTQTILVLDDEFGRIQFRGSDGVNFQAGASIRGLVDGTPGANSMPGRLIFMTTPTSSITPVERMRISQNGLVRVVDAFQSFRRIFDFTTQAAANTTTTLTSTSAGTQIFTGATAGQIVKLPDATTLVVGAYYEVRNSNTTTTLALQDNGGGALATVPAVNGRTMCTLLTNGTAAGTWAVATDFDPYYNEVSSTADMSLASTTDVAVTSMTLTPPAGVYKVTYNSTLTNNTSNNGQTWGVGVYVDTTQQANSDRPFTSPTASFGNITPGQSQFDTIATVTVNGSQAINIRARRSAGTVTINKRTLNIVRVG